MKMAGVIQKKDNWYHKIKHERGCKLKYCRIVSFVLTLFILPLFLTVLIPSSSSAHTLGNVPYWDGGSGADFAPVPWPQENQWIPYSWKNATINDPRVLDPSNGGTRPQNYVNVSSGCPDQSLPSIYLHYENNTLYFRWRTEQIPNTYAIGPEPGAFSDVSPWKAAQWTVMMDIDGDGYREYGMQLDGATGMPAYPVDILRTVYSDTLSQNMDPHDRDIFELWHNPTGFVDRSTDIMLNFQNSVTPTISWPNGPAETVWDYGTTRAMDITYYDPQLASPAHQCSEDNQNEYFVDYEIPLGMLSDGTYNFDCTRPTGLFFATANSLTNPFQKDVVANVGLVATPEYCVPFGDMVVLCGPDGPEIVPQPVVDWITTTSSDCTTELETQVRGSITLNNCSPNITAANFYYYFDADVDGQANDGGTWNLIGAGTQSGSDPRTWTFLWNTAGSGLQPGSYLIGVEAVNDLLPNHYHTWSHLNTPPSPTTINFVNPSLNPGVVIGSTLLNSSCVETVVVDKTVVPDKTTIGQNVQFTITVHNSTSDNLTVNSVTDYLPQGAGGITFTYASTDGGTLTPGTPAVAGSTVTWTFSPARTIAAGGTGTIIFTATAPNTEGTYQNTCGSNVDVVSWGMSKDIDCNYVEIAVGAPRLTIAKTADQTTRAVGEIINYTITYSNDSPANVTGAYITDVLPAGLTFVSASNGGTYTSSTRTIRWDIGNVQAGTGPFTVAFVASVTDPYPPTEPIKLKNIATIYSNETTPKQADVTIIVTGLQRPLLTIQKIGNKSFVNPTAATPDDRVTYTIAFSNVGNATATAATMTDAVPTGWVYVSSVAGTNCPAGTVTGNPVTSITWNLGDLAVGTTGICNLILRANDQPSQPYLGENPSTNTASIQATNFTPPVTSSFTVGLTGSTMTCPGQTYYFHNQFLDPPTNSMEIADTSPPSTGSSAIHAVSLPTDGCNLLPTIWTPIAAFYMDPVLINNGTTAPITNYWWHSKVNGNPMTVRVTMYEYDPSTGGLTQLGQGTVTDTGASQDPTPFSITLTPSQAPVAGDRLYMVYDACTGSNQQNLDIQFFYDGTYLTDNKKLIETPSHFCYQGYSVLLNKTVDKPTALPGDTLTYSVTFGNNGGSDVTGAEIVDTLPVGTTFVSATLNGSVMSSNCPTPGALQYCANGQVITFNVRSSDTATAGQITAGQQGGLVITATVDNPFPAGVYELINYSTLTTNETQPITSSARTVVTTDISISKSVDNSLLYPGDTTTFTITVMNSSGAAIPVNIQDVLPTDTYFTYVAGSASGGGVYTSATHTLDWTAVSVPANSSLSVSFQMTVALTGVPIGTTYKDNTAVVTDGSRQYSNTVTVVILNNPNIDITKSVSPAGPVAAGDIITWTMSVTNNGPQSALGVIVTDPIIAYTNYKAGTLVYELAAQTDAYDGDNAYFDAANNKTVFNIGNLPGGESRTMSFSAVIDRPMPNGTTTLTNTATVASSNTITKQASASIDVTDAPVFVLDKYAADIVASGADVTFTIYYKNTGGATATSVVVTDTLAANLTFVSADQGGAYDSGTRVVTWNLGTLPPDGEGALHLTVTPSDCGTYANTATIDSAETSPLNSNDSTPTSTVACALEPTKMAPPIAPDTVETVTNTTDGTQATYILTVTNTTSTTATDVQITDNFPEGFTYDSSVTPVFGGSGNTRTSVVDPADGANHAIWGTWDIDAGGSVTIEFTAKVDSSVPEGIYDNNVVATSTNKSVLLFDELATEADDVKVLVPVDLSVTKTVNIAEPEGTGDGAEFVYTITLTNVGVNHSFKVMLDDVLPADITYVSHTISSGPYGVYGTYDNGTGLWDVGRVNRGDSATLQITAYPNDGTAGMDIQNCVYLTSSVPKEPSYADPDDWSCVTIKPTLVTLSHFSASVEEGRVVVAWETVAELDTTGFFIERFNEETGKYVRLNKKLLPGLVISPAGGFYQLIDETAAPYGQHIYRLIEATSKGNLLIYGPFVVDLGGGGTGTGKIVKKFASDGTIEITIKGNVATLVGNGPATSGTAIQQETGNYSRKAREASPETKARLAAARDEQEKTKLRKKDRKGSAIKVGVLENSVYYIDSSDIGTMLNMPSKSVQQMIKNGLLDLTTSDGQASYMPAADNNGIFFYGEAEEGVYTNENIYWLKNDKGLLIGSVDGGKELLSGTAKDSFTETLHFEQELMPAPAMTTDPNSDYWFWDYVIADFSPYDSKNFSFEANSVSSSANTAKIRLTIMSITPERSHALISLNGTLVAEETWYGIAPHSFSVNVDQKLLREGDNTLTVKAVLDDDIYFSFLVIDSFDIEYARRFEAVNDLLSFKSEGSTSISVSGFSVPDITVFEISDTLKPKLVTSTSVSGQSGNYTVTFYPASNDAFYVAFASPSVKEADAIADLPSDLKRKDNAADYIVIAPEELKDGAELLADHRTSKSFTVKVVLIEDIMDEFSFGLNDPNAIKNFLKYAYDNWKKKPRYAVLVGSGTYDYKDAMGFGGNLIPSLMVGTIWGLVPSDSVLGDFTGDNVPEIVTGRIPALTPAEVQTSIDKIKSFESKTFDGFMMLADSPDGGGDFSGDSDDIAQILSGYPVQKIYLSDYNLAQARDLLFEGINRGVAFINYMGHAGIDQLSQGGLLTGYDAALMNNIRYPVLTAMSCMAGHYAYPGYESLSEILIVKNSSGIVSAWAPSDFSYNSDAKVLGEGFYKAVLQPDVLTIGEAVARSMEAYRAQGRASYELNIFNLLGDPALRIK